MPRHKVVQGECLSSLAEQHGFLVDTLWNHPDNTELRLKRKDANVLYPGDVVAIPEKQLKEESGSTEHLHRFRKKGTPAKLRIRLMDGNQPRANVPYQLEVDGTWMDGTTDGAGFLEHPIAPTAQKGKLLVGDGPTKDVFEWKFGTLDPIDTDQGVRGRLVDLGFGTDDMAEAIKAFQERSGLPVTGEPDAATRDMLKEQFGQ